MKLEISGITCKKEQMVREHKHTPFLRAERSGRGGLRDVTPNVTREKNGCGKPLSRGKEVKKSSHDTSIWTTWGMTISRSASSCALACATVQFFPKCYRCVHHDREKERSHHSNLQGKEETPVMSHTARGRTSCRTRGISPQPPPNKQKTTIPAPKWTFSPSCHSHLIPANDEALARRG